MATRGNAVHENERKSSLPSRESRRSTRGAMQEPEDELFWESDDQPSRRNVNVTFQESGSAPRSPDASLVRSGLRRKNTIEDDTDSDEEIFRRSQSRRTRGQRSQDAKGVMAKDFVMNGDDSHLQDMEEGPRRSSRRRKFNSFDQSWLVGNKKLRGYPSIVPSSEPENEEPRPSRKKCKKYLDTEVDSRRRRLRRLTQIESQEYSSHSKSSRCTRRRRGPPRRYREEPEHSEEEEERNLRPKKVPQAVEAPKEEDEEEEDDEEEKPKEEGMKKVEESPCTLR